MQRAFYGPAKTTERMEDLSPREITLMLSLMAVLLFLGLYPQPVLNTSAAVMHSVHQVYTAGPIETVPVPNPHGALGE
jgi:NADH-quinone oxidoreductase subunit M